MFVRRKKGKGKSYYYLCESQRVAGKSVHTTICALGHYQDNASELERQLFWQTVDSQLEEFSVSDIDQAKIKERIAEEVGVHLSVVTAPANLKPTPLKAVVTAPEPILESITNLGPSLRDTQEALLMAAIERFSVGLIIVAADGTILHENKRARTLLQEIPGDFSNPGDFPENTNLPACLWQSCAILLENQDIHAEVFSDGHPIVLEDEVLTEQGRIHVRTQWFDGDNPLPDQSDCFLITLENRQQSLSAIANQEAQRYGLTIRETDVWRLIRMGHSYKEISKILFISENTVKKHLKNIYAKKE